ncbi:MAG TPA: rhomboid family intramembrane serine protease [Candidatus Angelobacter sp.]
MPRCLKCGDELPVNEDGMAPVLCDRCAGRATSRARRTMTTGTMRDYPATTSLVAINLAVFAGMVLTGAGFIDFDPRAAYTWGGNYGPATLSGQYWRLVTAGFVHAGLFHFAINMWCLWSLGQLSERLFGKLQTFFIYQLTGIGGALLSIAHDPRHMEVGASGAVFGLAGALLAGVKFGNLSLSAAERKSVVSSMIFFVVMNFALGSGVSFFGANVDNFCHLGGFVTGLLLGVPMGGFAQHHKAFQWGTVIVTGVILALGYQELAKAHGIPVELKQAQAALDQRDYSLAIQKLEQYAAKNQDDDHIWTVLGMLYADQGQREKALAAFQQALKINPNSTEAKRALSRMGEGSPPPKK